MRTLILLSCLLGGMAGASELGPRIEAPKSVPQEMGVFVARWVDQSMRREPIKDFQGHCFALEGDDLKACRRQVLEAVADKY